ncbi:MAG: DUF5670 family protein [Bacteroidota bacterium]|nr:DUF5670 family protein [Bacteroidota bacterium]
MKKIITLSTVCIILSLLFSSCGSNTSLTKRHYNKGYYIAHTKGKHKVAAEKKDEKIAQLKIKEASVIDASKVKTQQNSIAEYKVSNPIAENKTLVASNGRTPIVFNTHIVSKHPVKQVPTFNLFPIKDVKHSIFSKKRVSPVMHDGDGLSLFWIIILVLLILWAFGLLGGGWGLGIFINVLLVIALILLILWLLRIV